MIALEELFDMKSLSMDSGFEVVRPFYFHFGFLQTLQLGGSH